MPKLSTLLAEKAKGEVQVGDSTVNFTFYTMWRERFTDEEWAELMDSLPVREQWKRLLPRVVVSWDIVDDDDHTIPVTAEAIEQFEIPNALLFAIWQRATNSDLSGKVSSNNSSSR